MGQPESMGECSPKLPYLQQDAQVQWGVTTARARTGPARGERVWMWMEGLKTCMCTEELVSEFPDRKTSIRLPVQCVPEVVYLGTS